MKNKITTLKLNMLQPHPDNPNRMSKENFRKLIRHIEQTGRYEPLTVGPKTKDRRPKTQNTARRMQYEIINGHHRFEALKQLGYETCDCVVWDIDDDEANLLLATLNRLCGQDVLEKKTALLEKLNRKISAESLAKLLPNTKTQIKRLLDLQKNRAKIQIVEQDKNSIAYPMVFFLDSKQKQTVEKALSLATVEASSKAKRNAQAITYIAKYFIENRRSRMAKKIKYVQLEPAEVLLDFHKSRMTAEQFGCYWLIILNLYCEVGKINFDLKELSLMCSCTENFEKVWEKIQNKFQKKKNIITHKRVTFELRRAKKFIQHQRQAGLKGAKKRWQAHSEPNGNTIAKESNVNEKEVKKSKNNRNEVKKNQACSGPVDTVFSSALSSITARSDPVPGSLLSQQLRFYNNLKEIIRPMNESDLTCFHRLSRWLVKEITFKRFNEHIFGRVLDIARESSTGSRNPAAVFMSRLKKELNYKNS